jgi:ATP-dependent exoDNAse (exonuclease V) beta subunit
MREYPLYYPLQATGQILRGDMDLLWFFKDEDEQEKCVLVDYKTFPGKRSELEAHTEKYYPQLSAYHAALTDAGIVVKDTLVYYPVQAHVRRLMK